MSKLYKLIHPIRFIQYMLCLIGRSLYADNNLLFNKYRVKYDKVNFNRYLWINNVDSYYLIKSIRNFDFVKKFDVKEKS